MQYLFNLFLRNLFHICVGFFYRYSKRVHITGLENIPKDAPFILCSNHPNAFMDAIVICMSIKRRAWILVRSDVFESKLNAAFFEFIGMLPIYRSQEGIVNVTKNDATFARCTRMLEKKRGIIIFPEGICIQERRLRYLRKGTARIALSAEDENNFKLGTMMVPVGLNYSATPWKYRSTLYLRFGEAFPVSDYQEVWQESQPKAINQFTQDLEQRMAKEIVIIEHKENDDLVAGLEEIFLKEYAQKQGLDPNNQRETHAVSLQLANRVNHLTKEAPERIERLKTFTSDYLRRLKKLRIHDSNLKNDNSSKNSALWDALFFFFGFPLWLFGLITNYIPYKVPYLIAKKTVKHIEWHASINATSGSFIWLICWLLESLFVALYFRNWWLLLAFMLIMPLSGAFAQAYWDRIQQSRRKTNFLRAMRRNQKEVGALLELRSTIASELER